MMLAFFCLQDSACIGGTPQSRWGWSPVSSIIPRGTIHNGVHMEASSRQHFDAWQ